MHFTLKTVECSVVHPPLGIEATEKTMCSVPLGGPLLYENITFVYNSEQLNGTQRVLLDNVLSEEQCRELHSVASVRTGAGGDPEYWPGVSSGALVLVSLGVRETGLKCYFL